MHLLHWISKTIFQLQDNHKTPHKPNDMKQCDYGAHIAKALKTLEEVYFIKLRPVLLVSHNKWMKLKKHKRTNKLEMMFQDIDAYALHQCCVLKYKDN